MTILIDTIRISGFRGIKNIEIKLPRVAVLIGTNNSGKTSVLKAMQLALGDYSRYIADEDFYIDENENRIAEILVDIRIVPVDENGQRKKSFDDEWKQNDFTGVAGKSNIQFDANDDEFLALRTRCKPDLIKGGFETLRFTLEKWSEFSTWQTDRLKESKLTTRFQSIPFIAIEAQRDIQQELKEKSSFVGKVLSEISSAYNFGDIVALEELIKEVNKEAINRSHPLRNLKSHLDNLNQSFQGSGHAEITPFPKKVRDLSKYFSVNFGETEVKRFPMEYQGMGTRSWASMLTVKSFTDLRAEKHQEEVKPFFPVLAAEEPEAHLHPNAQKTLYQQLADYQGQVIISTHSPYLAAMANIIDIRCLRKNQSAISINSLPQSISEEDKKILAREIMAKRAEIIFARALILFEGMTEEQVFPAMFEIYSEGKSLYELGISCISVGGKNYAPFISLAYSLGIPTYIVSDNDGNTKQSIESQLRNKNLINLNSNLFGISYLSSGNDFEAELLNTIGLRNELISAFINETDFISNEQLKAAQVIEITNLSDENLLKRMRSSKTSYSGFLADILRDNPNGKNLTALIPLAVIDAFNAIKGWLAL